MKKFRKNKYKRERKSSKTKASKKDFWLKRSKKKVKEELKTRSLTINYTSRAIEDIAEMQNLLFERIEEMYALYNPELKSSREKYIEAVLKGEKGNEGIELDKEDLQAIKELAELYNTMEQKKKNLEEYLEYALSKQAPNITYLVGSSLAAKLISLAGSLEKLADMPASTIQLLGAEKALFNYIKNRRRGRPPKHGILFQYPEIMTAPKKLRGKIARALAAKLAIAARADIAKHFIADKLKQRFDKRLKEIKG